MRFAGLSFVVMFLASAPLFAGAGGWMNNPDRIPMELIRKDFVPTFLLVRAGTFHPSGTVKPAYTYAALAETCGKGTENHAWVSHRIGEKEVFAAKGGKTLGESLNLLLNGTCFSSVELDIEVMAGAPPAWLHEFLPAVRKALVPELKLRLAVPVITSRPIVGNSWKADAALKVLAAVDGLDLMLYDTGAKTVAEYEAYLTDAFDFVATAPLGKKEIILGFPAYKDRSALHPLAIENLVIVRNVQKKLPKDRARVLCDGRARIAYFALYAMDAKDRVLAKEIEEWKKNACK